MADSNISCCLNVFQATPGSVNAVVLVAQCCNLGSGYGILGVRLEYHGYWCLSVLVLVKFAIGYTVLRAAYLVLCCLNLLPPSTKLEEVTFSPVFVCLFVLLSVSRVSLSVFLSLCLLAGYLKMVWMDFTENLWEGGSCAQEEMVKFW